MITEKKTAVDWIWANRHRLSHDHLTIWNFAETAWREYKSAAWYVDCLRREGFTVEAGSGGMPTAFVATYGKGRPVLGAHAEYDAVPGQCQAVLPRRAPREGLHPWAAGHTDPHSALGIGGLAGVLAAKAAMDKHRLAGTLKFFGEPAEKVCGSKPIHAARGYYDDLDAMISFHPHYLPRLTNTLAWDTHCGCYWSKIYTFECESPETWGAARTRNPLYNTAAVARAPGANDALSLMYAATKHTKEAMLPHSGSWTLNEAILTAGDATADNLPPRMSQIQYAWRAPTIEMAERVLWVLDNNAEHVAAITHTKVTGGWVSKTRCGLANHAIAELCYRNFAALGPPRLTVDGKAFAREIQTNLGLEPMAEPFLPELETLITPEDAEAELRRSLPPWQLNYTSDDYVEYTWHAPTARLYVGRPMLRAPEPHYRYPDWVRHALGGHPDVIDPMIYKAGEVIGCSLVELLMSPEAVERCRAEFVARTGGGIGGTEWLAPLLPRDFPPPIHYRWPEYVTTARGEEWSIPTVPRV